MNDYIRGIATTTGVFLISGAIFAAGHRAGKKVGARELATQYMVDTFQNTAYEQLSRASDLIKKAEDMWSPAIDTDKVKEWLGIQKPSSEFSPEDISEEQSNPELKAIEEFAETSFFNKDRAQTVLDKFIRGLRGEGKVSIADYRSMVDPVYSIPIHEEELVGWTNIRTARIHTDENGSWILGLPKPQLLSGVNYDAQTDPILVDFSFTGMSFKSKEGAEKALQGLLQKEKEHRWVSVRDYNDVVSKPHTEHDDKYGWSTVSDVKVVPSEKGWTLDLPPVTYLPV